MSQKTALLLGATGLVGGHLLKLLLESEHFGRVVVLSRKSGGAKHEKLQEIILDFNSLDSAKPHFAVDVLFCCLGTTIKKAKTREAMIRVDYEYPLEAGRLAKEMGVGHYAVVSSIGANADSPNAYLRTKGRLEADLKSLDFAALSIFQPSLLLGKRQEFRFGEGLASKLLPLLSFAFAGKLKKYKAVAASDVAKAMYSAAYQTKPGTTVYPTDEIIKLAAAVSD
ncbi:oxidoreductase [Paenibacillus senegalensis]|uniref:oxidoreductase n=1 Tax=Paenibacillus senegalensis TaxID=1465766 RepID=UPI0002889EE9|nr:oxidoreductase [Paenibacillus senegalensis]